MIIKKIANLLGCIFMCLFVTLSCVYDVGVSVSFKNCTDDTLFVGASHYDNIDSIEEQVFPNTILANGNVDTTVISLWKDGKKEMENGYRVYISVHKDWFICPDSMCTISGFYLFNYNKTDTCYFFLIKLSDAKKFSWDEIRSKKLYGKWIVAKNKNGDFDRNIKY